MKKVNNRILFAVCVCVCTYIWHLWLIISRNLIRKVILKNSKSFLFQKSKVTLKNNYQLIYFNLLILLLSLISINKLFSQPNPCGFNNRQEVKFSNCLGEVEICLYLYNASVPGTYILMEWSPSDIQITDFGPFVNQQSNGYAWTDGVGIYSDGFTILCIKGIVNQDDYNADINFTFYDVNYEVCHTEKVHIGKPILIDGNPPVLLSSLTGSNGPLVAPGQSAIKSQNVQIEGKLIVDQNYTFGYDHQNSQITMEEDATIEIDEGITLNCFRSNFYSCNNLWNSIEVDNGATLKLSSCKVDDATNAVTFKDGSNGSIFRSEFRNNLNSLYFEPNNGVKSNHSIMELAGLYIYGDDGMKEGYAQPHSGVNAIDLNTVPFFGIGGVAFGFPLQFENLEYGVKLNNADVVLNYPIIQNIGVTGVKGINNSSVVINDYPGSDDRNTFVNMPSCIEGSNFDVAVHGGALRQNNIGIKTSSGINNSSIIVEDAFIESKKGCIWNIALGESYGDIINNNKNEESPPKKCHIRTLPDDPEERTRTIYLSGNDNSENGEWVISNNNIIHFDGTGANISLVNTEHVEIVNNPEISDVDLYSTVINANITVHGGDDNEIQCNQIIDGSHGTYINNSSRFRFDCNNTSGLTALLVAGSCENSKLRGNTLDNLSLQYGLNATVGYTLTGPQPLEGEKYNGNHYEKNPPGITSALNYDPDYDNVNLSLFRAPDIADYFPFSPVSVNPNWFTDEKLYTNFICPSKNGNCNIPGLPPPFTQTDIEIRNGIVNAGLWNLPVDWTLKYRLY